VFVTIRLFVGQVKGGSSPSPQPAELVLAALEEHPREGRVRKANQIR